jgi:hypothetical protein
MTMTWRTGCPSCGVWLPLPEFPKFDAHEDDQPSTGIVRRWLRQRNESRRVIVNVECGSCKTTYALYEDTGEICRREPRA